MKRYAFKITMSIVFSCLFFTGETQTSDRFKSQRIQMVNRQIKDRGISNQKVLDAFITVPRHLFVLPEYREFAYIDSPLPITEEQTISQPFMVAFMTNVLNLKPKDKVLEIGTGSGYQAAILSQLCDSVFTIEIFESLSRNSQNIFRELGYHNIFCKVGDGYQGWEEFAPFDAIIVTCSPTHIPPRLKDQLAEGGRMVIPVGDDPVQNLVLLRKKNGKIKQKEILPVRFVPMITKEGQKYQP